MKEEDILRFEQVLALLLASGHAMDSGIFRKAVTLAGLQDHVLLDDSMRISRRPDLMPILDPELAQVGLRKLGVGT